MIRKLLVKNVVLKGNSCDILINGNIIEKIESTINEDNAEIFDGQGMVVMPGFVNAHTHAAMTLTRGVCEDTPLQPWLQNVWAIEAKMDGDAIYWGTKLAIVEMLKSGTTNFNDMYWFIPRAYQAAEEMGIRATYTYVLLNGFDKAKAEAQKKECLDILDQSRSWNQRVKYGIAIHADYTVDEDTMVWGAELARKEGLILHTHIAETSTETFSEVEKSGLTPVQHYDKLGVLGDNVIAAHCVWLNEDDIAILGKHHVNVVHNVNSNLKLSSGYKFKYDELIAAGANVCLGTDGASSSNNLDMRESAKTMALLQKAWRNDPATMHLDDVMAVLSKNGSKALGVNAGEIAVGKLADIIFIDTDTEAFVPNYNFESNFIYAANSSCIKHVMVDGKFVMKDRHVDGEEEIRAKAREISSKLINA